MAVSISSDIVMGVMRAAPADRLFAATQKLGASAAAVREFETALGGVKRQPMPETGTDVIAGVLAAGDPQRMAAATERLAEYRTAMAEPPQTAASRGLETTLIRTLLESMVPDGTDAAFGGSFASGIWRSMAVDHMASLYADAGGLGLSPSITASLGGGEQTLTQFEGAQWPRFDADRIRSFTG